METKACVRVELKSEPEGLFVAVISTFNKPDKYGDVVKPGAFRASIDDWFARGDNVPVIYAHQHNDIRQWVGHVNPINLHETATGLEAAGRFDLEEEVARKVFRQLQRRALSEWSFAYEITKSSPLPSGGRALEAVQLVEIGPCLRGVGTTQTISVKADGGDRRSLPDPLATHRAQLDRALRRVNIAIAAR